jgi:hypothetical protein
LQLSISWYDLNFIPDRARAALILARIPQRHTERWQMPFQALTQRLASSHQT